MAPNSNHKASVSSAVSPSGMSRKLPPPPAWAVASGAGSNQPRPEATSSPTRRPLPPKPAHLKAPDPTKLSLPMNSSPSTPNGPTPNGNHVPELFPKDGESDKRPLPAAQSEGLDRETGNGLLPPTESAKVRAEPTRECSSASTGHLLDDEDPIPVGMFAARLHEEHDAPLHAEYHPDHIAHLSSLGKDSTSGEGTQVHLPAQPEPERKFEEDEIQEVSVQRAVSSESQVPPYSFRWVGLQERGCSPAAHRLGR